MDQRAVEPARRTVALYKSHPQELRTVKTSLIISTLLIAALSGNAGDPTAPVKAGSTIVKSDTGRRGGHVTFEALPSSTSTNILKKRFHIESL